MTVITECGNLTIMNPKKIIIYKKDKQTKKPPVDHDSKIGWTFYQRDQRWETQHRKVFPFGLKSCVQAFS